MLKSEIKIIKEEYESYKADLLNLQEELKKCYNVSDKADIRADISKCRTKIYFLEDLSFKLGINEELGL